MSIKSIEIARTLERTFATRGVASLEEPRGTERISHGGNHAFIICDLGVSRALLASRAFQSYNYFREGLERLEAADRPAASLGHFFDAGLLFREGRPHHEAKHAHRKLLDAQGAQLERRLPELIDFFAKRHIEDPLAFSRLFVRLCLGLALSGLTSAPLTASMRALRRRENVFYYHFHPTRHQRLDLALAALRDSVPGDGAPSDETAWLAGLSLVVMGYDPLVASLCAALSDREDAPLAEAPARYCPTSFVSRLCVEEKTIAGQRFTPGDICYVSLVPDREGGDRVNTFPFGLGVHSCVGRWFSAVVLGLAETVVDRCFPGGFRQPAVPSGDGAFLMFRTGDGG